MKAILYFLLTVLVCCCNKSEVSIDANKLHGTWELRSSTSPSKTRWTFDPAYLYIATSASDTCRPAEGQPWEYRVTGKTFHARYVGISHGLITIPDIRYEITDLSDSTLTLENGNSGRQQFFKCR
ncbi:hypothetical protein [Dyadobacter fermentans]|uniref:Lipocalin-like domain-containing protein n=1 Tax=Dyadobacter fermentans (strain ATCC 700827 / DSM 18053 / CIP 107007 / KCTC 52180 / NS114) TaxID=471854 RepID=C6VZN2_DYAFD|nr:hypothetical protein [Dyadobacter fermentans]ACT93510.1 hypothetical protein Dfer_2289 [Dyadobacter fermentans DSM 18053]